MVYAYTGSYSSLEPGYGQRYSELFTGYRLAAGKLGASTSVQTANQISEVTNRLSEGMQVVEMGTISPEIFEQIPKQQFKEINRLSKLTGSEVTMHAPAQIDPSGFTERGWSDAERAVAERQLFSVVERAHEANPEGNIPVTVHASAIPAAEWRAGLPAEEKGTEMLVGVDQETGEIRGFRREKRWFPEEKRERWFGAKDIMTMTNNSQWQSQKIMMEDAKRKADELIGPALTSVAHFQHRIATGEKLDEVQEAAFESAKARLETGHAFLSDINASLRTAYHRAYKYDEKARPSLEKAAAKYRELWAKAREAKTDIESAKALTEANEALLKGIRIANPQVFKSVEKFAPDKASETISNIALRSFEKWGERSPVIGVENVMPNMAFSRADQLAGLIEKSREKFIEKAIERGISRGEAKRAAERFIGVTWDIGHINMLRRAGYKEEDIFKETQRIAPFVKHVHIADNFGYSDSHLPPGMGEVPVKEIMKRLEKEGYAGKAIVEAGAFAQQFKISPHPYVLEAMGPPLYYGAMAPFWNQVRGAYGAYFMGYGAIFPEQHFSMYGAGFSGLPTELGGEVPGKRSRFAGAPAE